MRRLEIQSHGDRPNLVVAGQGAKIVVEVTEQLPTMECQLTIANSLGQPICTLDSEMSAPVDVRDPALGPRIECEIPALPLMPGRYRIDVHRQGQATDPGRAAGGRLLRRRARPGG